MTLAQALDAEREHQGLSVNALARAAGMSPSRAHEITTGKVENPGILTVAKMLAALGKSLSWLDREMRK